MSGYKLRLILHSQTETWREVEIPDNITFERLHYIIQKLFGFYGMHMWEFRIPKVDPESDEINLDDIERTIDCEHAYDVKVNEVFDKNIVAVYEYDFGDSWEIIAYKTEDTKYKNKTALITDYNGKYNPKDDMGGIFVFDEIMNAINDGGDVLEVLDEYGLKEHHLELMDFEQKFEIGSRIRLNDPVYVLSFK